MLDSKDKLDIIIPVFNELHIAKLFSLLEKDVSTKFRVLLCYDEVSDKTLTSYNQDSFNFKIPKINTLDLMVQLFLVLKNVKQKLLLYIQLMTS